MPRARGRGRSPRASPLAALRPGHAPTCLAAPALSAAGWAAAGEGAMGAAVFFGCTFIAFGPALALCLLTVAGDPLRVIILVAG